MNRSARHQGYTLIEVIIAIVILAIISGGLAKYLASRTSSAELFLQMQSVEVSKYILHQRKLTGDWMPAEVDIHFAQRDWLVRIQSIDASFVSTNNSASCIQVQSQHALTRKWGPSVVGCSHE